MTRSGLVRSPLSPPLPITRRASVPSGRTRAMRPTQGGPPALSMNQPSGSGTIVLPPALNRFTTRPLPASTTRQLLPARYSLLPSGATLKR